MNTSLQRLGKYRLQERVDGSGIAEVWKAFSPQLRRFVAIKILHADLKNDPRFITRFEREAKAIAPLHHPNIVQMHDFQASRTPFIASDPNTIAYLVMDYIDGLTLADYIGNTSRKKNFPTANEIVQLFVPICAAIDYAHSKGIIHGDLKPSNILLDTHALERVQYSIGKPIVTDFGITRLLGTPAVTLSRLGLVTPFYLSPKQAMGYAGDVSSDIYSLGVILYELCTGVLPFEADSPSVIMMQHITATPTPPIQMNPDISPALSRIILRCLDKNPMMRFPSASAMAAALTEPLGVPLPMADKSAKAAINRALRPSIAPEGDLNRHQDATVTTAKEHSPYIAPDNEAVDARVAEQSRWSDGLVPRTDSLMPINATTSNSMPDRRGLSEACGAPFNSLVPTATAELAERVSIPSANAEDSQSTVASASLAASWQRSPTSSNWSPSLISSSPNWPPPSPPPPTPAFPLAPMPSLLNLALGRLGYLSHRHGFNLSLQRARHRQGVGRGHRGVLRESHLVLLAVLILLLIVSSLGTLLVLAHKNTQAVTQQVGYAYFLSSGQLHATNNQGINDEVQIDLHGIAAPYPGKSYYAWLLGDENASEVPWMLLGKISENQGNVHFLYTGDAAHTNLLTDMSRFVITEDKANRTPNNPLLDYSAWRYYGEIYQTPSPKDVNHFSMLDHIRHLLVQAPELQALGLPGGLSIWLMRNVEEVSKWTLDAKEAWETKNVMLMSRQIINILYYIDGDCASADLQGMPPDMPTTPENGSIAHIAHFSLTNPCIQEQQEQANQLQQVFSHTPHDYVDHMLFHLAGVIQSPGATPAVRTLAIQLDSALNYVRGWLEQVRKDALQLSHMPDNQLTQLSALSTLSDMEAQARYAYAGQTDPSTAEVHEGVTWIYDNTQRLASIDVMSYPPQ